MDGLSKRWVLGLGTGEGRGGVGLLGWEMGGWSCREYVVGREGGREEVDGEERRMGRRRKENPRGMLGGIICQRMFVFLGGYPLVLVTYGTVERSGAGRGGAGRVHGSA